MTPKEFRQQSGGRFGPRGLSRRPRGFWSNSARHANGMYLGLDLGTSELKALAAGRRPPRGGAGTRAAHGAAAPALVVRTGASRLVGRRRIRDERTGRDPGRVRSRRCARSACRARCTARCCWTTHDAVLRPAILWNDGRSGAACEALTRGGAGAFTDHRQPGDARLHRAQDCGGCASTNPRSSARTARVLLPKDCLRLRLTGEAVTDCSDASGTLWLDVGARRWSREVLAACGLSLKRRCRAWSKAARCRARLRPGAGRVAGVCRPDLPVAGGGGDNAASAVGMGAVAPGQGFVSLGTSGVIFRTTGTLHAQPGAGPATRSATPCRGAGIRCR